MLGIAHQQPLPFETPPAAFADRVRQGVQFRLGGRRDAVKVQLLALLDVHPIGDEQARSITRVATPEIRDFLLDAGCLVPE